MGMIDTHDRIQFMPDSAWVGNLERAGLELRRIGSAARQEHLAADDTPHAVHNYKWTSWADDRMGVFVADMAGHAGVAFDLVASTDMFCFRSSGPAERSYTFGDQLTCTEKAESVLVFLPKGTDFGILSTGDGIRGVTLLADAGRLAHNIGLTKNDLPRMLQECLDAGNAVAEKLTASIGTQRIANEIADYTATDRCPSLYLEGKCRQLMWSMLDNLYRNEDQRASGPGELSERDLENLARVRVAIEANPCADHPIEYYSRVAAMNRTKLRSAFKRMYGETISQYRTSLRMNHADRLLRDSQIPISQIGYEVGYADASSFFVAFKKYFGQSPGRHRHH